jgi:hypothetical protein
MNDIVYVLGAGVNKAIKDKYGLSSPLINDFFQNALKKYKDDRLLAYGIDDYINTYWGKSISDLENDPFDLEECFTLLDMQIDEARKSGRKAEEKQLYNVQSYLKAFFIEYLSDLYTIGMEGIEPPNPPR